MSTPIRCAIIVAAGRGQRMWPYDEVRPKAILPIMNRPLITRLVDDVMACGISHVIVVIGHHGQRVRHALAGRENISFVQQSDPHGTAEATLLALSHLSEENAFLVVHGDLVLDRADVRALLTAYQQGSAPVAALVQSLDKEDSRDWLCATTSGDYLTDVQGHPRSGESRLCGVYAMRADIRQFLENNPGLVENVPVGGMPPMEADLAASIQMMIEQGVDVLAVHAQGLFVDLDKPWHILQANREALRAAATGLDAVVTAPGVSISDGADIRGPVIMEAGARIGPRTVIDGPLWVGAGTVVDNGPILGAGVMIGADCTVANYCQISGGSVIGSHGVVDHCAEIGGVTMDRVYLSHYMEFWGVAGSAVDLGAATVCGNLRFDDGQSIHRILGRPERPAIGANAVYLGDYCRTGVNVILMPGVKVGSYSCLGPGMVVYEDVPAHSLMLVKQEIVRTEWGPQRYGW